MSSSGKRGETPHDIKPGPSGSTRAALEAMLDDPGMKDTVSFLARGMDPELSKLKGRGYYYPIPEKYQMND